MSSVAEWNLARVLAAAKEHRCGLRRFKFVRGEASPRMRSITQRLLGALAAAAPEIGLSCLDFYPKRCLLGDLWCFLHQISTLYLVVHPTDNYVSASPQAPIRFVAALVVCPIQLRNGASRLDACGLADTKLSVGCTTTLHCERGVAAKLVRLKEDLASPSAQYSLTLFGIMLALGALRASIEVSLTRPDTPTERS